MEGGRDESPANNRSVEWGSVPGRGNSKKKGPKTVVSGCVSRAGRQQMWPGGEVRRGQQDHILWALQTVMRGETGATASVKQEKEMTWFPLYQIPLAFGGSSVIFTLKRMEQRGRSNKGVWKRATRAMVRRPQACARGQSKRRKCI